MASRFLAISANIGRRMSSVYYPQFYRCLNTQVRRFPASESRVKRISLYAGILTWLGLKKEEEEEDPLITVVKMGILSMQKEEYNVAESTLHIALKMAQERANMEAETYIYDILANVAFEKQDYAKAEKLFLEVNRRILIEGKRDDDDAVIEISLKLSKIYSELKQYDKAEIGFKYCIDVQQKKLAIMESDKEMFSPKEQENTLVLWAMGMDWYARLLMNRGYYEESLKYYKKALTVSEKINGISHPRTLGIINDIGTVACHKKDFDTAIEMFKIAIERSKENETSDLPCFYYNLGSTYIRKDEPVLAKSACRTALKLAKKFKNESACEYAKECLQEIKDHTF